MKKKSEIEDSGRIELVVCRCFALLMFAYPLTFCLTTVFGFGGLIALTRRTERRGENAKLEDEKVFKFTQRELVCSHVDHV